MTDEQIIAAADRVEQSLRPMVRTFLKGKEFNSIAHQELSILNFIEGIAAERASLLKDVVTTSLSAEGFAEKNFPDSMQPYLSMKVGQDRMDDLIRLLKQFAAHAVAKDREKISGVLESIIRHPRKHILNMQRDRLEEWLNEKT